MELQIKAYQAQPIEWNYEALKTELLTKLEDYKHLQYTAEQITMAKADRANLNNLKKALSDERIRRKKEFLEPFETFERQVKELCDLIDEPVQLIDKQIKEVEEKEKAEKKEACRMIFEGTEGLPDWLKYEQIENVKWYNKTTSIKAVSAEIDETIKKINANIELISALPEFSFEAMEEYKITLDASRALSEGKRLADIQKRKAEAERQAQIAEERTETPEIPFADTEPIENTPATAKAEEKALWLSFRAYLTASQAAELKSFCTFTGIIIEPIKEDK